MLKVNPNGGVGGDKIDLLGEGPGLSMVRVYVATSLPLMRFSLE